MDFKELQDEVGTLIGSVIISGSIYIITQIKEYLKVQRNKKKATPSHSAKNHVTIEDKLVKIMQEMQADSCAFFKYILPENSNDMIRISMTNEKMKLHITPFMDIAQNWSMNDIGTTIARLHKNHIIIINCNNEEEIKDYDYKVQHVASIREIAYIVLANVVGREKEIGFVWLSYYGIQSRPILERDEQILLQLVKKLAHLIE